MYISVIFTVLTTFTVYVCVIDTEFAITFIIPLSLSLNWTFLSKCFLIDLARVTSLVPLTFIILESLFCNCPQRVLLSQH